MDKRRKTEVEGFTCPECTGEAAERVFNSLAGLHGHTALIHRMSRKRLIAIRRKAVQTRQARIAEAKAAARIALVENPPAPPKRRGRPPARTNGHSPTNGNGSGATVVELAPLAHPPNPPTPTPSNEPTLRDALNYLEGKHKFMAEIINDFRLFLKLPPIRVHGD